MLTSKRINEKYETKFYMKGKILDNFMLKKNLKKCFYVISKTLAATTRCQKKTHTLSTKPINRKNKKEQVQYFKHPWTAMSNTTQKNKFSSKMVTLKWKNKTHQVDTKILKCLKM